MKHQEFAFAVAQSSSVKGDMEENIRRHRRIVRIAAEHGASTVVFPELSLTGYEPTLAAATATVADAPNLGPLQADANAWETTVVVGCPIRSNHAKPYIGSIIFRPNLPVAVYRKRFVHPDELPWFTPSDDVGVFKCANRDIGFAICFDISHAIHASDTFGGGATLYAASVAKTPEGVDQAQSLLSQYAREYRHPTAMANHGSETGGMTIGGRSAVWREDGSLVVQAPDKGDYLALIQQSSAGWQGRLLALADAG